MPTYLYRCPTCLAEREQFNRISECETAAPECCAQSMRIAPVVCQSVHVQMNPHYQCVATGERITTMRQREEVMKRHHLVDAVDHPAQIQREKQAHAERARLAAMLPTPPPELAKFPDLPT